MRGISPAMKGDIMITEYTIKREDLLHYDNKILDYMLDTLPLYKMFDDHTITGNNVEYAFNNTKMYEDGVVLRRIELDDVDLIKLDKGLMLWIKYDWDDGDQDHHYITKIMETDKYYLIQDYIYRCARFGCEDSELGYIFIVKK